jgi:hypothetical protein
MVKSKKETKTKVKKETKTKVKKETKTKVKKETKTKVKKEKAVKIKIKKREPKSKKIDELVIAPPEPIEIFRAESLVQKLETFDDMIVFKCPGKYKRKICGNTHFRHAGYMEFLVPWIKPNKEKKISNDSVQVKICTKCKSAFVYLNDVFYDVTDKIDLKAWEKTEKEMQKATGPGGEC